MPGPSAQARGGDACFKPPKASAWEKGRLSFTRFPSLRPCARAPQRRWKEIRQHPPPTPQYVARAVPAPLPTAWHRQGRLPPEVYRRGNRIREARHPAQGHSALASKN